MKHAALASLLAASIVMPCSAQTGGKAEKTEVDGQIKVQPSEVTPATRAGGQGPIGPNLPVKKKDSGPTPPNAWFAKTRENLGTFIEGETGVARFDFVNPNSETHQLTNIQPNCQCAKAKLFVGGREYSVENDPAPHTLYRIDHVDGKELKQKVKHVAVGANEKGYVEIHLSLKGIRGPKRAYISMRTTDPKLKMLTISAEARGVTFFKVVPPEVNLNKMSWDEEREFSFEISSEVKPSFAITDVEPSNEAITILDTSSVVREGQTVWTVRGKYTPTSGNFAGGGALKLHTDIDGPKEGENRAADVRVLAVVEGPMTLRPGTFIPFGRVKRKEGASKTIEIVPNGAFELDFTEVEVTNLTVDKKWVELKTSKDGRILKLDIVIKPNAPRRLIRGDIKVGLNHPAEKEKAIQFNGFVR